MPVRAPSRAQFRLSRRHSCAFFQIRPDLCVQSGKLRLLLFWGILPEPSVLVTVPPRAGECHDVEGMGMLNLVGDFANVVVEVARMQ